MAADSANIATQPAAAAPALAEGTAATSNPLQASSENPAAAAAGALAADDDKKAQQVFAGNLAFATTEDELKQLFSEAGTVTSAQIITRGTRSLGYGFVTFTTESEANKAVTLFHKREIAGREINVESAKARSAARAAVEAAQKSDAVDGEKKGAKSARGRGRGGRRGGATGRRPRTDEGEEGTAEGEATTAEEAPGTKASAPAAKASKPKGKAGVAGAANGEAKDGAAATEGGKKAKAAKKPREPKGTPEGTPSKTLVFVSNLPFNFSDAQLRAVFDSESAGLGGKDAVKSAKVVKRPHTGKTKGFGFVDLKDEATQTLALEKIKGITVEGREIGVKVAVQTERKVAEGGKDDAAAVAASAIEAKPEPDTAPSAPGV
ncbi:FOG: RRM domain [Ceraceosorus bombacis]|uniref:FOG: RRM domain n=1 Tax=Ceraceosorus bombacis TaxID=401625 RepID=A0A0N7L9H9_9BASI|nr:FOG: RRM domain [Ceraceosorus bombacis]